MKVTIFNAKKTTSKYPASPFDDGTFFFETKEVQNIFEVFDYMSGNFMLSMPLIKNTTALRQANAIKELLPTKLNYIIIDIDHVETHSNKEMCIKYFRDRDYEVILGESRNPMNIKGVMKCEPMSIKEAKQVLTDIQEYLPHPAELDMSVLSRAGYQAPIHKHKIHLQKKGTMYPKPTIVEEPVINVKVPDEIAQMCIDAFNEKGFSFNKINQDGYTCSHPSEVKSKNGFTWTRTHPFWMSHWNQARNVSVWNEVVQTPEYKKYQKAKSKQQVLDIIPVKEGNTNKRYLDNCVDKVTQFIEGPKNILRVQSPMGTGKSAIIEETIHQSRKNNLKVLFITNRISLADDIAGKYDNIKHYLGTELEGNEYNIGDNLVIQIDSLHKISPKYFDVVILDEYATTMLHLLSIEKHQRSIIKKLFSLSKRKLLLADAFLFDTDIFGTDTIDIVNDYRDDTKLTFYKQKDNFVSDLIKTANDEPITFSSGSTQILKIVKMLADQQGISNITISSETPPAQRELIYKSMQSCIPRYQILMYSPTLTVGVSNENKALKHFHYDGGMSMNVLSSIQMIKRTRKAQTINLWLAERTKYLPVDELRIWQDLTDFRDEDDDGDDLGMSETGLKLAQIIKTNNTLENRHKVSFLELLRLQFDLKNINYNKVEITPIVSKLSKIVKKKELDEKLDIFEEYQKMTPEELSEIECKMFGTNKKEIYVKEFQFLKSDETLELTEQQLDQLVQEEIKTPGVIASYKNIKLKPELISTSNNYQKTLKEYNKYLSQGINLLEYGYKKVRNKYVLNETLKGLL